MNYVYLSYATETRVRFCFFKGNSEMAAMKTYQIGRGSSAYDAVNDDLVAWQKEGKLPANVD